MKKDKNDNIIIQDWTGKVLFEGNCDDDKVIKIMRKNQAPNDDIFVYWLDPNRDDNVYEYILW
jgi:hypothetical protein